MIVFTDICPLSGLNREMIYISSLDDTVNKNVELICNINYYYNNQLIGTNILNSLNSPFKVVLSQDNILDGISEYDYWKGSLNDFNALINKGFNSYDSFISYIVMKTYLKTKFI